MLPADINSTLKARFGEVVLEYKEDAANSFVKVAPAAVRDICRTLKDSRDFAFDGLMCLSGVDAGANFQVVYHLYSYLRRHKIVIKTEAPRENPVVKSVESVWAVAGFHEREAFDLLGIVFEGNSDLRRIMMPEDWPGHPLRKDYQEIENYRGVSTKR